MTKLIAISKCLVILKKYIFIKKEEQVIVKFVQEVHRVRRMWANNKKP